MHALVVGVFHRGAAAPLDPPGRAIHPVAHPLAQPEADLCTLPPRQQHHPLACGSSPQGEDVHRTTHLSFTFKHADAVE